MRPLLIIAIFLSCAAPASALTRSNAPSRPDRIVPAHISTARAHRLVLRYERELGFEDARVRACRRRRGYVVCPVTWIAAVFYGAAPITLRWTDTVGRYLSGSISIRSGNLM